MIKKKLLIVTQDLDPYTALSEIAEFASKLPLYASEQGMELRILMPRFGVINERRHRLHEVVRLSGMNIIVDDDDFPLIIKVASLPGSRMQVYFLDNDEFFRRKAAFEDEEGNLFPDNPDRMAFFCKGVIETVKKFGWAPDIIHCHGWMTSLVPFYMKTAYKTEPLFQHSKVVYSVYDNKESVSPEDFMTKASINNLKAEDLQAFLHNGEVLPHLGAVTYADAVIRGSETMSDIVGEAIARLEKPFLDIGGGHERATLSAYTKFYNELLASDEIPTE